MSKIIAEIGVNWSGDLQIAREMILQSKRAGADSVKFQMFNEEVIKGSKYEEELSVMILKHNEIRYLSEQARMNGIGFGVSVMYPEGFTILEDLELNNLDFIKIRFKDHCNEIIARPAVEYCTIYNISLLISTQSNKTKYGDYFRYNLYPTKHAKYMYCVPEYPPEINEINLKSITTTYFDGYSNHFPSKYLPMLAVSRGLEYIEVHVKRKTNSTVAESLGYVQPQIDENVSIDFNDLEDVCKFRDLLSKLRGG